jgi:hypothetical protein
MGENGDPPPSARYHRLPVCEFILFVFLLAQKWFVMHSWLMAQTT